MWWNFTEYLVKLCLCHNAMFGTSGKPIIVTEYSVKISDIYIYIYIYGMVLHAQLFTECTVKKWHCCSPSIVLQIVH